MTGHCAPACHCATSSATVPVMYNSSTSNARSGGGGGASSSSAVAAPLLVPKPKPDDVASINAGAWLGIGLAGLVVLAFVLVIIFGGRNWNARV